MKLFSSTILILLSLGCSYTRAAENNNAQKDQWCQMKSWHYKRNLSIREIKMKLDTLDRMEIVQLFWNELFYKKNDSLLMPLAQYLAGTETKNDLIGYFKSMGYLASKGIAPEDAIKSWPQRVEQIPLDFDLNRVCELFELSAGSK